MASTKISRLQKSIEAYKKLPYDKDKHVSKQAYYRALSETISESMNTIKGWFVKGDFWARYDSDSEHTALKDYCDEIGIPFESVGNYWHKGKHFSVHSKTAKKSYFELRDVIIDQMNEYSPKYPTIKRIKLDDPHLLVVDPADIHLGKLSTVFETGDEYNIQIAVNRALEGVEGLINRTRMYNFDKVVLIGGNDILHTDTPNRKTTSGTPQDTDGMWYNNFIEGRKLYVKIIEMLMTVADVHMIFCPSNHDFMSGFFLCDTISSWFSKCENITFDADMKHRKYFTYGNNLIGATHGDGAKQSDLPSLMAVESPDFSRCDKRYIYGHHIHHKTMKDYIGVTFESMRSQSGTDGWHHRNGYVAPKAVEAFIHHPIEGQVGRITHYF